MYYENRVSGLCYPLQGFAPAVFSEIREHMCWSAR
ncbi:hypothetical protein OROMI_027618 [Orobanche minor]